MTLDTTIQFSHRLNYLLDAVTQEKGLSQLEQLDLAKAAQYADFEGEQAYDDHEEAGAPEVSAPIATTNPLETNDVDPGSPRKVIGIETFTANDPTDESPNVESTKDTLPSPSSKSGELDMHSKQSPLSGSSSDGRNSIQDGPEISSISVKSQEHNFPLEDDLGEHSHHSTRSSTIRGDAPQTFLQQAETGNGLERNTGSSDLALDDLEDNENAANEVAPTQQTNQTNADPAIDGFDVANDSVSDDEEWVLADEESINASTDEAEALDQDEDLGRPSTDKQHTTSAENHKAIEIVKADELASHSGPGDEGKGPGIGISSGSDAPNRSKDSNLEVADIPITSPSFAISTTNGDSAELAAPAQAPELPGIIQTDLEEVETLSDMEDEDDLEEQLSHELPRSPLKNGEGSPSSNRRVESSSKATDRQSSPPSLKRARSGESIHDRFEDLQGLAIHSFTDYDPTDSFHLDIKRARSG